MQLGLLRVQLLIYKTLKKSNCSIYTIAELIMVIVYFKMCTNKNIYYYYVLTFETIPFHMGAYRKMCCNSKLNSHPLSDLKLELILKF